MQEDSFGSDYVYSFRAKKKSRSRKPKRKTGWENLEENSHLIKFAAKRDFTHLTSKMAPYRVFPLKPGKKQEDNILFIEDAGR